VDEDGMPLVDVNIDPGQPNVLLLLRKKIVKNIDFSLNFAPGFTEQTGFNWL
jgi:hypothetical protein